MGLDLNPRETEILDEVLQAALTERLHQIHHAHSRDYRKRLEREVDLIEGVRARLPTPRSPA